MKIFLTGSEGFIGRKLRQGLRTNGHEVREYDLVYGQDILDKKMLKEQMEGIDVVIHLAGIRGPDVIMNGQYEEEDLETINYEGTKGVVETAHELGIKRFVYASTNDVYGFSTDVFEGFPIDDTTPYPYDIHAYAKCKLDTEEYFDSVAKKYDMSILSLRIGGIDHTHPWNISITNLVRVFDLASTVEMKPGFEWINVTNPGCPVDLTKAKKVLGYGI